MQNRKVTYQLYESPKQAIELVRQLHSHKNLWNAALEERIDAWKNLANRFPTKTNANP